MSSSSPSEPLRVVLLVGREATLRDAALAELREACLGGGPRDFNEDRFDFATAGTDWRAVITACRTLPVMSPQRLVVVTGLSDKRAAEFLEGPLLDYLEAPAETTRLVLQGQKVDKRHKWVKRAQAAGRLIDCTGPSKPAEVRAWIDERIRSCGKKTGRGAAQELFDLIGADLDRLAFEIDKLCLFVGDAPEVTADDVAGMTASLRPLAVYELTDEISSRSIEGALRVLARMRDQGAAPLAVLGALANHLRRLLRAHDCHPLEAKNLEQTLGLKSFPARKLAEQARRFDPVRLRRGLDAVRRTDEALKGAVPLPPALAVEQLVLSLCS